MFQSSQPTLGVAVLTCLAGCAHQSPMPTTQHDGPEPDFRGRSVHVDGELKKTLDSLAPRAARELGVPGAALAVIHGGQVVLERSWGERRQGGAPVTPNTLFMIGSVTKPMTTMMQAVLVDRGRLCWTSKLVTLLPDFAVADAQRSAELSLFHASCACSGVPGYDMVNHFEFEGVSAKDRIATLRDVRPTAAVGARYQYSNLMVVAGGYAAAHVDQPTLELGKAYERAMHQHVLAPIGMSSSTFDFARVRKSEHALPHAVDLAGQVRELPLAYEENVRPIRPAGGLWSTLHDMTRYAQTELSGGVAPGGKRVVSTKNLHERWEPRVRKGDGNHGYGLGMGTGTRHGLRTLSHSGGSLGFGTTLFLLPDQDVAVVILTNVRNGGAFNQLPFNTVILQAVLEELFDATPRGAAEKLDELVRAQGDAIKARAQGVELAPGARWLNTLAGLYRDPRLGDVHLRVEDGAGIFDAGEWQSRFGRSRSKLGAESLVLLDAPYAGTPLELGEVDGKPSVIVPEGNQPFRLVRVD